MKLELTLINTLYANLERFATKEDLIKYEKGKERILDILSMLQFEEPEKYKQFELYFKESLTKDYCWTVVGFWGIIKEYFPKQFEKYLKMKKASEYLL